MVLLPFENRQADLFCEGTRVLGVRNITTHLPNQAASSACKVNLNPALAHGAKYFRAPLSALPSSLRGDGRSCRAPAGP